MRLVICSKIEKICWLFTNYLRNIGKICKPEIKFNLTLVPISLRTKRANGFLNRDEILHDIHTEPIH